MIPGNAKITDFMPDQVNILVYGYGNPGRQDDGLGKALIDLAEEWLSQNQNDNISLDVNYQLQVEDVTEIYDKDLIIFVDASMREDIEDFSFERVEPDPRANFSMHSVSPAYILALCEKIYGKLPPAYLLHVRGYEWELSEPISSAAQNNMQKAWSSLREILLSPELLLEAENNSEVFKPNTNN